MRHSEMQSMIAGKQRNMNRKSRTGLILKGWINYAYSNRERHATPGYPGAYWLQ